MSDPTPPSGDLGEHLSPRERLLPTIRSLDNSIKFMAGYMHDNPEANRQITEVMTTRTNTRISSAITVEEERRATARAADPSLPEFPSLSSYTAQISATPDGTDFQLHYSDEDMPRRLSDILGKIQTNGALDPDDEQPLLDMYYGFVGQVETTTPSDGKPLAPEDVWRNSRALSIVGELQAIIKIINPEFYRETGLVEHERALDDAIVIAHEGRVGGAVGQVLTSEYKGVRHTDPEPADQFIATDPPQLTIEEPAKPIWEQNMLTPGWTAALVDKFFNPETDEATRALVVGKIKTEFGQLSEKFLLGMRDEEPEQILFDTIYELLQDPPDGLTADTRQKIIQTQNNFLHTGFLEHDYSGIHIKRFAVLSTYHQPILSAFARLYSRPVTERCTTEADQYTYVQGMVNFRWIAQIAGKTFNNKELPSAIQTMKQPLSSATEADIDRMYDAILALPRETFSDTTLEGNTQSARFWHDSTKSLIIYERNPPLSYVPIDVAAIPTGDIENPPEADALQVKWGIARKTIELMVIDRSRDSLDRAMSSTGQIDWMPISGKMGMRNNNRLINNDNLDLQGEQMLRWEFENNDMVTSVIEGLMAAEADLPPGLPKRYGVGLDLFPGQETFYYDLSSTQIPREVVYDVVSALYAEGARLAATGRKPRFFTLLENIPLANWPSGDPQTDQQFYYSPSDLLSGSGRIGFDALKTYQNGCKSGLVLYRELVKKGWWNRDVRGKEPFYIYHDGTIKVVDIGGFGTIAGSQAEQAVADYYKGEKLRYKGNGDYDVPLRTQTIESSDIRIFLDSLHLDEYAQITDNNRIRTLLEQINAGTYPETDLIFIFDRIISELEHTESKSDTAQPANDLPA